MKLIDLLNEELVVLEIKGTTKKDIIAELSSMLDKQGRLHDKHGFENAVLKREATSTTGIGFGVAIPHGKTDAVSVPSVVFAKHIDGVDWDSLDGEPVQLIFLIAVPESHAGNEHLKILQMLSRKLIHDDFRNALLKATSKEEVLNVLKTVE
ncbi:fructose PTS transporter subunit IIA [Geobacillus stearothermophilus]|nr:fructose PTS transporter subunit IIA [Geobacillus stearothermophilus]